MAMSTITVGGINPSLNILGTTQQFIFSQQGSVFRLNNTFIPTSLINSETDFDIINNRLSGFRWYHTTTNTDTYGSLTLQSFVNAQSSSSGTNILQFNNSGIGAFADLNMNSHSIIGATWSGTTITVSTGGTGLVSTIPYSLLCGGTTSTGALQSVASLGTSGQLLTSQGASALPQWTTPTTFYVPTSSVPSAPGVANDGIYSVNLGKAKFTSGTATYSGTIVTANSTGAAATCGQGILTGQTGTTIFTSAIQLSSLVNITRNNGVSSAPAGTSVGHLSVASIVAGTSFKVYSTSVNDIFGFNWQIINP